MSQVSVGMVMLESQCAKSAPNFGRKYPPGSRLMGEEAVNSGNHQRRSWFVVALG
jgi:hypothetical protein